MKASKDWIQQCTARSIARSRFAGAGVSSADSYGGNRGGWPSPEAGRKNAPSRTEGLCNNNNNGKSDEKSRFLKRSLLYQELMAEREEILRHKWLESERLGYDIGLERALWDWIRHHREEWRAEHREHQEHHFFHSGD